jgi:pyruvate dehydrogenase E2 component (dihydrolipoamide acetyltransferase)
MSQLIEVKVPDIGDFADVPVIELFVKVGDTIKVDDAIATLESDKATMDVPSSAAGVVKEVLVQLGDRVAEGAVLIKLEAAGAAAAAAPAGCGPAPLPPGRRPVAAARRGGAIVEVKVPDIGDFADVPVIELFVKVGDSIKAEDAIATLESDKATMDVPSSATGVVKEVLVQLGSKVSEGAVLIKVETGAGAAARPRPPAPRPPARRVAGRRRPGAHAAGDARPGRHHHPPSSSAAWCTPARRCVPSPANWASISPRSRPPAPRTASPRPTSPPSSRAP